MNRLAETDRWIAAEVADEGCDVCGSTVSEAEGEIVGRDESKLYSVNQSRVQQDLGTAPCEQGMSSETTRVKGKGSNRLPTSLLMARWEDRTRREKRRTQEMKRGNPSQYVGTLLCVCIPIPFPPLSRSMHGCRRDSMALAHLFRLPMALAN